MTPKEREFRKVAHRKYGKPSFFFSEDDMIELLQAFFLGKCPVKKHKCKRCIDEYGVCQRFRSRLDRLDHQDKLQKDRSILTDPTARQFGNPMLSAFSHDDIKRALESLKKEVKRRSGQQILGWSEYCLRVLCGKSNPNAKQNQDKPEVRDVDKIRAMVDFTNALMPSKKEKVQSETDLSELFEKLSEK